MRKTKIYQFIGVCFAIIVLVLFAAVGTTMAGMQLPILYNISEAIGITGPPQ